MTTTTYFTKIERTNGITTTAKHNTYSEMMNHINAENNVKVDAYKVVNGKVFCQMRVTK